MAHSCPICDQYCHCGGDIDDIQLDGTEEQMNCCHCDDEWEEGWDEEDIWIEEESTHTYQQPEDDDSLDPNDSRNL